MMLLKEILPKHLGRHRLNPAAQSVKSQAMNSGEQSPLAPFDVLALGSWPLIPEPPPHGQAGPFQRFQGRKDWRRFQDDFFSQLGRRLRPAELNLAADNLNATVGSGPFLFLDSFR